MTASSPSRSRAARRLSSTLVLGTTVGLSVAVGLAGCSAGQLAQTANQVPAVPGSNLTIGTVALRDLQLAYPGAQGYPAGANVPLIVRIFNDGTTPVRLIGVTAEKSAKSVAVVGGTPSAAPSPTPTASASTATGTPTGSVTATGSATPTGSGSTTPTGTPSATAPPTPPPPATISIEIPAQSFIQLVPGKGPYLQLVGLIEALNPGESAEVTFAFDNGATAPLKIPFAPAPEAPRASPVVPNENKEE